MAWAVARPAFKVPLFRFIDALPACRDAHDVLDHLDGYLDHPESPWLVRAGLHAADAVPGGARAGQRRRSRRCAPHGDAVHRRPERGRRRRGAGGAVARRLRRHRRPARREDAHGRRRRPLRGAGGGRAQRPHDGGDRVAGGPAPADRSVGPAPPGPRVDQGDRAGPAAHAGHATRGGGRGDEQAGADPRPRGQPRRHHPPGQRAGRGEGRHVRTAAGDRRGVPGRTAARLRRAGLPHRRLRRPPEPDRLERGDAAPAPAGAAGEGGLLGRRDHHRRAPTGGRRRSGPTRPIPTPTTSAAPASSSRAPATCGPPSPATTSAASPTRSRRLAAPACRTAPSSARSSTAWPHPSTAPCGTSATARGSTCRSASWCRAWPTSCAGCSRTPPTTASCGCSRPAPARSTACSPRPRATWSRRRRPSSGPPTPTARGRS